MGEESKIQQIALSKCKHFSGRQWCGYFTYSEILLLVKLGAKHEIPNTVLYYQTQLDAGISRSVWFYFYPSRNLLEKLEEK